MQFLQKAMAISAGSVLLAIGVNIFFIPHNLLDGGMVGVGLIVHYLLKVQTGLTIIIASIPIFAIAWVYNRSFFYNSLHGMFLSSFVMDLFYPLHIFGSDLYYVFPLASAIFGGILVGAGVGLMLRFDTSTGGTDLLAQLLSSRTGINSALLIFLLDGAIVLTGSLIIANNSLALSLIAIFMVGITTNFFVSDSKKTRAFF